MDTVEVLPEPGDPPSDLRIYEALKEFEGNITNVAISFDVPRYVIAKRINEVPLLNEVAQDFRQSLVDVAEEKLARLIAQEDGATVRFVASTLGKDRGYSTGVAGMGKGGAIIVELRSFGGPEDASTT